MLNDTLQLIDQKVLNCAEDLLEFHLPLEADGYCCATTVLVDVLLGVEVNGGTVEWVCADLTSIPDPETIGHYFNDQFSARAPAIPTLLRRRKQLSVSRLCARMDDVAEPGFPLRTHWFGFRAAGRLGLSPRVVYSSFASR
jgi:hypothetical protein